MVKPTLRDLWPDSKKGTFEHFDKNTLSSRMFHNVHRLLLSVLLQWVFLLVYLKAPFLESGHKYEWYPGFSVLVTITLRVDVHSQQFEARLPFYTSYKSDFIRLSTAYRSRVAVEWQ